MKIALAYPWTDPDGAEHEPDEVLEVPLRLGKQLVRDGLARAVMDAAPAGDAAPGNSHLFDPNRNTVNAVLAHLAAADDGERVRVLDAERAGKAREGVLNFTEGS